uniref:Uncharacterized protein n=1 Tax=Arundo donax TaxID=35708 RepID=A0A0A8ZPQ5_ARUDO
MFLVLSLILGDLAKIYPDLCPAGCRCSNSSSLHYYSILVGHGPSAYTIISQIGTADWDELV